MSGPACIHLTVNISLVCTFNQFFFSGMQKQNGDRTECKNLPQFVDGLPKDNNLRRRLELLSDEFYTKFKTEPTYYFRIPGRVNLIGEHIDYCGYSVCPMALQQDILVVFRPSEQDKFLCVYNQDVDKYSEYTTDSCDFK